MALAGVWRNKKAADDSWATGLSNWYMCVQNENRNTKAMGKIY